MEIREAVPEDAPAICQVLRRSISELCVADHKNNPEILAEWLGNKTPELIASWIASTGKSYLVAVKGTAVLGVGCVTDTGEIALNYVSPEARFQGVSRAILRALEARAIERGNTRCTLTSTETAHRIYRTAGYADAGPPTATFNISSTYPMCKHFDRELSQHN